MRQLFIRLTWFPSFNEICVRNGWSRETTTECWFIEFRLFITIHRWRYARQYATLMPSDEYKSIFLTRVISYAITMDLSYSLRKRLNLTTMKNRMLNIALNRAHSNVWWMIAFNNAPRFWFQARIELGHRHPLRWTTSTYIRVLIFFR